MDKYEKSIIQLELGTETPCDLKHNDRVFHRAVNAIEQPIGHKGNPAYSMTIFICEDCQNTLLYSSEWILLFCLKCTKNQWIYKPLAKMEYGNKHICWSSCCPYCHEKNERVNIFFTE